MRGQWIWDGNSNKGKGMGKGQSKGGGKGGKQQADGDWICKEVGCTLAAINFAWRTHCMGCGCKHRSTAEIQRAKDRHVAEAAGEDKDGFVVQKNKKQRRKE